ncbi:YkgJ family cysteine cluster protein [Magnetospirillum sp. 64-120]|uniref:YkgJ family cysteine cluster protein n=2 Tax=Magnetospirillum TaxID=13134 RepID=UPI0025BF6870|nr:YkgJ family cysteine cluster protein [Magnetospirillum sp. 64-120]
MRDQTRGAPPPPLEQAAFEAARANVAPAMKQGSAAVLDAVLATWADADRLFDKLRANPAYVLGAPPAACRRGCGWCCHQKVGAAAAEVLAMSRALAERPTEARMLQSWKKGQPCAFLKDGACAVYDIRPLKCRSLWHVDVRHCMAKYAGLPVSGAKTDPSFRHEPKIIYEGALKGLALPLIKQGHDCPGLELMPALKAVMDNPDAASQWWMGKSPFPAETVLDWFPKPAKKKR